MNPNPWQSLVLDLALIGATVALGLKHAIDNQAITALLGALAGGRLVSGTGAVSALLARRTQPVSEPKDGK